MNNKLMKLKYWEKAFIRLAILVGGMLMGCILFAVVVIATGLSPTCDGELYLIFRNTIFIIGALILITTVLLVRNSTSLEKELRRRKNE